MCKKWDRPEIHLLSTVTEDNPNNLYKIVGSGISTCWYLFYRNGPLRHRDRSTQDFDYSLNSHEHSGRRNTVPLGGEGLNLQETINNTNLTVSYKVLGWREEQKLRDTRVFLVEIGCRQVFTHYFFYINLTREFSDSLVFPSVLRPQQELSDWSIESHILTPNNIGLRHSYTLILLRWGEYGF